MIRKKITLKIMYSIEYCILRSSVVYDGEMWHYDSFTLSCTEFVTLFICRNGFIFLVALVMCAYISETPENSHFIYNIELLIYGGGGVLHRHVNDVLHNLPF